MPRSHGRTKRFSELSNQVIGAAIDVHRELGPGLLESAYSSCLAFELQLRAIPVRRECPQPVSYKGFEVEIGYRLDIVIADQILVEVKSVSRLQPVHEAQVLTYLRLSGLQQALLLNFNVLRLKDGLRSYTV